MSGSHPGLRVASDDDTRLDLSLMSRLVEHDSTALAELYDRHNRLVFGLLLRMLGQRADAEEVLQDVFMAVWRRSSTYDPSLGTPIAWLVRVARNRAIDRLRANHTRVRAVDDAASAPTPSVPTPHHAAVASEQQSQVARALGRLAPEHRVLIEQAYFQGLTQVELAERHQLPLGTVKTRVRNGLLTLRQHLTHL